MTHISIKTSGKGSSYEIHVGDGLLKELGAQTAEIAGKTRAVVISNPTVADIYGKRVLKSLETAGLRTVLWTMKDGEKYKSLSSAEAALSFLADNRVTRSDVVIALGGGVVGDLAGFVSSVYLRGIPYIQVPTTLLSMIDSSVGGKTGVNTKFGKNLVGSFYSPGLVIADISTLRTLPEREMTAGLCEAIKQGAISGRTLFNKTAAFVSERNDDLAGLVAAQIAFKASIVKQDQYEDASRRDPKSRKILNFGHTFAHALEKATSYRYFRHGEAVGWGIIFASTLSNYLEILDANTLKLLNDVVHRAGRLPSLRRIDPKRVLEAFGSDKKNFGGGLQWILLAGIGKPVILPASEIPTSALQHTFKRIFDEP